MSETEGTEVISSNGSRRCEQCAAEFLPKRWWRKFCSEKCRSRFHVDMRRAALIEYREVRSEPTFSAVAAST